MLPRPSRWLPSPCASTLQAGERDTVEDPSLEDHQDDEYRYHREGGAGHDVVRAPRLLGGELLQRDRQCVESLVVEDDQRPEQVVPVEDEAGDGDHGEYRLGQRYDHPPEDLPPPRAGEQRRLLQLPGEGAGEPAPEGDVPRRGPAGAGPHPARVRT